MRIAHLNAQLSLFDIKFDGKKWPKSSDDLIGGTTHKPAYTEEQWRGLAAAMKQQFSDKPLKKKRKK